MQFKTTLKVRGYHLDFYGHVNNARYLELLEEARWRMLEGRVDLNRWQRENRALVVVRMGFSFEEGIAETERLVAKILDAIP